MFKSKEEVDKWFKKYNISNYDILNDLTVYISGELYMDKNGKFTTKHGIKKWLEEISKKDINNYRIFDYEIQDDLVINVVGDVYLNNLELNFLPIKFGTVGSFSIDSNNLTNFEGFPHTVRNSINLNKNKFTSLMGYKAKVAENVFACHNPLYDLRNEFIEIGKILYCNEEGYGLLKSLKLDQINNIYKKIDFAIKLDQELPMCSVDKKEKI